MGVRGLCGSAWRWINNRTRPPRPAALYSDGGRQVRPCWREKRLATPRSGFVVLGDAALLGEAEFRGKAISKQRPRFCGMKFEVRPGFIGHLGPWPNGWRRSRKRASQQDWRISSPMGRFDDLLRRWDAHEKNVSRAHGSSAWRPMVVGRVRRVCDCGF